MNNEEQYRGRILKTQLISTFNDKVWKTVAMATIARSKDGNTWEESEVGAMAFENDFDASIAVASLALSQLLMEVKDEDFKPSERIQ